MRYARCSRRQPPRRRCPPAPARSDSGLYVVYAQAAGLLVEILSGPAWYGAVGVVVVTWVWVGAILFMGLGG